MCRRNSKGAIQDTQIRCDNKPISIQMALLVYLKPESTLFSHLVHVSCLEVCISTTTDPFVLYCIVKHYMRKTVVWLANGDFGDLNFKRHPDPAMSNVKNFKYNTFFVFWGAYIYAFQNTYMCFEEHLYKYIYCPLMRISKYGLWIANHILTKISSHHRCQHYVWICNGWFAWNEVACKLQQHVQRGYWCTRPAMVSLFETIRLFRWHRPTLSIYTKNLVEHLGQMKSWVGENKSKYN